MSQETRQILVDFLRHGEPEGGDILRGRIDPVLTEAGWRHMRAALGVAPDATTSRGWQRVINSPLLRCRHFACYSRIRLTVRGDDIGASLEFHNRGGDSAAS